MSLRRLLMLPLVLLCVAIVGACGSDDAGSGDGELTAVATTTQVADFVRNVGGERVDVRQILQPNSDPHDYEPRPSDARGVAEAQVVFRSGGDVDAWLDDLIESAGGDVAQVELIDAVRTRSGGHDHEHGGEEDAHAGGEDEHGDDELDPHWWQDPRNAVRAVRAIRDELIDVDPDGRAVYERNARRYLGQLQRLDRVVAACIDRIPPRERTLVTTHDALGYYAGRYGLDVVGAVIPSLSTQAQPSAKDVDELVDQIRETGVKAIYPESSVNAKLEDAVARESGARIGKALWADTLGPEGSSGATYLGSIAANTEAIADGLSGGSLRCEGLAEAGRSALD